MPILSCLPPITSWAIAFDVYAAALKYFCTQSRGDAEVKADTSPLQSSMHRL